MGGKSERFEPSLGSENDISRWLGHWISVKGLWTDDNGNTFKGYYHCYVEDDGTVEATNFGFEEKTKAYEAGFHNFIVCGKNEPGGYHCWQGNKLRRIADRLPNSWKNRSFEGIGGVGPKSIAKLIEIIDAAASELADDTANGLQQDKSNFIEECFYNLEDILQKIAPDDCNFNCNKNGWGFWPICFEDDEEE